ncbi:hypothetical protein JA13_165 [Dickeya phage vB_DsoM_JA13]|uniref:Uncharacterized protein n=1 Tax=Dickeya phage vB_DsoM_JA13 TaxID=2283030 RepID=A0A384ZWE5_9CAUD|nr:hypothetical protein JA13_165 [Dickeya phage vB_DsoM_JA13]
MSHKDFQSTLRNLLGELARSNRSYSVIAGNIQESVSADLPPIVLPDAVIQLMEMGVIDSKVAFTQEDLLAILSSTSRILVAIKSASEVEGDHDLSLADHIAHYQETLSLKTNAELLSYDLKDPFVACGSDAERLALAMVLDDLATDRKIVNKPYIWRTILNNSGKL